MERTVWMVQSLLFTAVIGLALFGCAGRFDLPSFWAYLCACAACCVVAALAVDPALFRERIRPGGRPLQLRYYALLLPVLAHWCLAGLDAGRFHWSDSVPRALQAGGLVIFVLALALTVWAMRVNPFFSSVIRIQDERGQEVVTDGPYRWVRHPGYAAGLLLCLSSGVALGSGVSALPALASLPLLIRRTVVEDRFLKDHLKGYPAYADSVRDKLIPGVW